jgi:uncharacterized protein YprB with RNaseH-like and TPR domain
MKLGDKFGRLTALRAAVASARPVSVSGTPGAERLAELTGATVERNRYGEYLAVRQWFSTPEPFPLHETAVRRLAPDAGAAACDPERWLFLDTETTGLAGGTGTYAFLVGLAWWDAGGLQVEQLFMRDHGEEHSLLLALRERLAERTVLVTFNGKSFDWPLLETRFRMTRQISVRPPAAHLDLLHPARQLWRLRLGSVRLSELERAVAGFERGFDIRSDLIPALYFEFLRGGPAEPLADVFRHNQMDLRGLAAVAGRMCALLGAPEAAEGDALELYGLSRLLRRRGEARPARQLYERALGAGLPEEAGRAARRELAALAKRDRDFGHATSLWSELIQNSPDELEAYEELAIFFEHRAREPQRAATLTREALAALREAQSRGRIPPARSRRLRERLEHRLARLERKAAALFERAAR